MPQEPFRPKYLDTISAYMRQQKTLELAAHGAHSQTDSIRRMMDQLEGPAGVLRHLRRDPYQDTVSQLLKRIQDEDGWRSTIRAINEAHQQRDLVIRARNGTDLLAQRELALVAYTTGISRTAELISRNRNLFATTLTASRSISEIAGMASSIVRQMESLKLSAQISPTWTKALAEQYAEQFGVARRAAEEFKGAETDEERSALLVTLFLALVSMMRAFKSNTKQQVLGLGALALLGAIADVAALLPQDPLPGMPAAQVQMIEATHREIHVLREEFKAYKQSEDMLDEAWVAELPRAELKRNALIRDEAARDGRVLAKLKVAAPVAIMGTEGNWKQVAFRDPLTDELAKGWVYGPLVNLLD